LFSQVEPVSAVLARPHGLLEGPRFGPAGELVYSDVIAGGVWACSNDGVVRELLAKRRGIGGIVPHQDGGWVLSGRDLLHLSPDASQRVLFADNAACGFNDLGTTPTGDLLAGVLRFRPLAGDPPRNGQLLQIKADGTVEVLTEEIVWPNGIGVTPDGRTLYVSDYAQKVVLAVSLDDRSVHEFCRSPDGSVDGLALDCEGGV
jgi:sugar lactone lactonase YvrE